MTASRGGKGHLRLAVLVSVVAGAVLGASGAAIAAVSDSPPTTPGSTDPVSTVTLLPPPQTTPAPKPDPVPVHVHTTPARTAPPTTAPAQSPAARDASIPARSGVDSSSEELGRVDGSQEATAHPAHTPRRAPASTENDRDARPPAGPGSTEAHTEAENRSTAGAGHCPANCDGRD